jgi:hypothetical protein
MTSAPNPYGKKSNIEAGYGTPPVWPTTIVRILSCRRSGDVTTSSA